MSNSFPRMRVLVLLLTCMVIAATAQATLLGAIPTAPGSTVVPGLATGGPGTLLASLSAPFTNATGTASGTLVSAVYREAGGTLDFYYQVINNTTSMNCGTAGKPACDPLARETDFSFLGFTTALGFRTDVFGPFVVGSVAPVTGDRNAAGTVIGFSFLPPDSAKIQPGQVSFVLAISTNATNFTSGFASVSDGSGATVASFEPAVSPTPTGTPPTSTPTNTPTNAPTVVAVVPTLNESGMLILGLLIAAAGLLLVRKR